MTWFFSATVAATSLTLCVNCSTALATGDPDQCDGLASHSTDPTRPPSIAAVDFDEIDSDKAISACQSALAAQPNDARMAYQLGRALLKAEQFDEAVTFFAQAAQEGHVKAMVSLGNFYRNRKNGSEAFQWFRRAADAGFSEGFLELGNAYSHGLGVAEDKQEAVRLWRRSAEYGDPLGMNALGNALFNGTGVTKNQDEGYRWLRRSAEAGNLSAMTQVAIILFKGTGIEKNEQESVQWLRKAADAGYADAAFNLGVVYWRGNGLAKDQKEALRWFRQAADKQHVNAMHNLRVAYERGIGVEKDPVEAFRWLKKSADRGDLGEIYNLAVAYSEGLIVEKDEAEAARLWRKAAGAGHLSSMVHLGFVLSRGEGLAKDEVEAVEWFRKAAGAGHISGMKNLGIAYLKGIGVTEDRLEAIRWFRMAAEKGDETAAIYVWKLKPVIPRSLPSTEEFMGIISACATSNKVSLEGDIRGSIKAFYEGLKAEGGTTLSQTSDLLKLFPESDRTGAYTIYVSCVTSLVNKYHGSINENDVRLIRSPDDPFEEDYKIALSPEAASRLDGFQFNDLISKAYYVAFSVTCNRPGGATVSRGPFVLKYANDIFSNIYNGWLIRDAYKLPDNRIQKNDSEDESEATEEEDQSLREKMLSDVRDKIRNENIIFSVSLVKDIKNKHKELTEDIANVFGNKCSLSDLRADLFINIRTTGKDGFDDKHFFKLSGAVTGILDAVPQIKAKLDRSTEAEFAGAKNKKVAFRYERITVSTSGNNKMLVGLGAIDGGMSFGKFDPKYVQPTVRFLRTVKSAWKM